MKYFAVIIIASCVILNFMIINDYGNKEIRRPVPTPQLSPAPTGQQAPAVTPPPAAQTPAIGGQDPSLQPAPRGEERRSLPRMQPPAFYRGIYLHNYSARVPRELARFIREGRAVGINSVVLDLQDAVYFRTSMIPRANVEYCLTNGIYPIARIVVFPYGLKEYPVPEAFLQSRIDLAVRAAEAGFPEVQFDYIRFEDSGRLGWVPLKQRFALVEGFLARAKRVLARYGVRTAADIFGRVTMNSNDPIGQRLDGLDGKVHFVCPMVYPSHFTWSRYMMANPWYTVWKSSVMAKQRLKQTEVVQYLQGFILKVSRSGLSLPVYIAHQIKACHDAQVRGYIVWEAAQAYRPTWEAMRLYYGGKPLPGLPKKQLTMANRDPE